MFRVWCPWFETYNKILISYQYRTYCPIKMPETLETTTQCFLFFSSPSTLQSSLIFPVYVCLVTSLIFPMYVCLIFWFWLMSIITRRNLPKQMRKVSYLWPRWNKKLIDCITLCMICSWVTLMWDVLHCYWVS